MHPLPTVAPEAAGPFAPASAHQTAQRLDAHASCQWQASLARHGPRLERVFVEHGSAAYDTYLRLLLAPPLRQMGLQQLQWFPCLPGGVADSRSFVADGKPCRKRWLTVALCGPDGAALGMLVVAAQERLDRFEVARRPMVFALDCMGIAAVRAQLRRRGSPSTVSMPPARAAEEQPT